MADVRPGQDLTPYPEVNITLNALLTGVKATLGDRFFGMYLYGSLATGDFNPERSDIDFVVVTDGELPEPLVAELGSMHTHLAAGGLKWAAKLEGTYIPLGALRAHHPDDPPRPTINEGRFFLDRLGSDWVIERAILREFPLAVAGPSLRNYIDPVGARDLRLAIRGILREWWKPMLADPARMANPEYQPFAVLSICRALYTLEHGTIVSKTVAGRWATVALERKWAGLIEDALAWRRGDPPGSLANTLDLIRLGVDRYEQWA